MKEKIRPKKHTKASITTPQVLLDRSWWERSNDNKKSH